MGEHEDKNSHVGKIPGKVWSYEELLDVSEMGGSCGLLDIENEFAPRPYETECYDLSGEGFPLLPAVGASNLKSYVAQSPWHAHRGCIEFILCRRGLLRYESASAIYDVPPGSLFVSRERESHRQVSADRGIKYFVLKVSCREKDWIRSGFTTATYKWFVAAFASLPRQYAGGKKITEEFLRLLSIVRAHSGRTVEWQIRLDAAVRNLLLGLVDAAKANADMTAERIRAFIKEMTEHPERRLSQDELISKLRLSPTGLTQVFKSLTGFPPHAYQLKCRIDHAKDRLLAGDSAERIAADLGFSSRQHFATAFKRFAGSSPRTWTQKHRKKQL